MMGDPSSENVRLGIYFMDLILMVCQSTAKTAKIGSLENFRLYGTLTITPHHSPRKVSGSLSLSDFTISLPGVTAEKKCLQNEE